MIDVLRAILFHNVGNVFKYTLLTLVSQLADAKTQAFLTTSKGRMSCGWR